MLVATQTATERPLRAVFEPRTALDDPISHGLHNGDMTAAHRAPLNARGDCRSSAFELDSEPQLRADTSTDTNLDENACYVWGVRTLDNVGNAAPIAWSGFVVVERR